MVTSALLCLTSAYKDRHSLENLVSSPQILQNEVLVMQLQKPMVLSILLCSPMAFFEICRFFIGVVFFHVVAFIVFVCEFLFVFMEVVDLVFFSEEGLEIVSGLGFLLMSEKEAMRIG